MQELTMDQYEAMNNVGLRFDRDAMDAALRLMFTSYPEVTLTTVDGYTIKKEEGEHGDVLFENIPLGKLSAVYTESPEAIKVMLAAKVEGDEQRMLLVLHFLLEAD